VFHVILLQPEIPPNTGNIMRLCANTGCTLHLVRPLGFVLDDRRLRRAGLDYREWADVAVHDSLDDCLSQIPGQVWAATTRAQRLYHEVCFEASDGLLFGPETRGLPASLLASLGPERLLRIPMLAFSRSLNLSNSVAVVVYEGLRQLNFPDCR
jgi:tRNA (cytidine/uridine-2'-O-)-methyltransferase